MIEKLTASSTVVSNAELYSFKFSPHGWAIFTLSEDLGTFSIQSDWGDYSYRWSMGAIAERSLKHFLVDCNPDYIANKMAYNKEFSFKSEFDFKSTQEKWRNIVLENHGLSKEASKELLEAIENLEESEDPEITIESMNLELSNYLECPYEDVVYRPSYEYLFLRDSLIPFFQKYLQESVLSETGAK